MGRGPHPAGGSARLSVTLPKTLWSAVCPPGASPSAVIQEALRMYAKHLRIEALNTPFDGVGCS
jgi:hypothetical protein